MRLRNDMLVLLFAAMGGSLGYVAFFWVARQGFYGLVLPGGLVGLAAGIPRGSSTSVAAACGVLALALGLFTEWRFAPFTIDGSLGYFLTHIHHLQPITLVMIAVGGLLAFWIPSRRIHRIPNAQPGCGANGAGRVAQPK